MQTPITKPRIVAFEITQRCRYHCIHCRAGATGIESKPELTTTQCIRILQSLAAYRKCVVVLTGGEPLERKDLYELVEVGRALGHRIAIASSGYPITYETAHRLKASGLLSLSFSIDGPNAQAHDGVRGVRGAFRAVLAAISNAQRQGILYQINTVVTQSNLYSIKEIGELAQELGAYCFNPFLMVPTGRGNDLRRDMITSAQYEELLGSLAELRQWGSMDVRVTAGPQFQSLILKQQTGKVLERRRSSGCSAAGEYAFINYRGDVQPCGFLALAAGNLIVNDYDFATLWEQSPILNQLRDRSRYDDPCATCADCLFCGGCRARAYALTGNYLASDPLCFRILGKTEQRATSTCVDFLKGNT